MLTGDKNLDFKILNKLDDVDLVKACQTNRQANEICNDQTFWLNRILNRFPYLGIDILKQYKGNRNWSQYYINDLRQIITNNAAYTLFGGSETGRLDHIIIAINKGVPVTAQNDYAVRTASELGYLNVVKYLVSQGADIRANNHMAIIWASRNGHLDVVKYLVSQGADIRVNNDVPVKIAGNQGHHDIVDYFVSLGAPDPRIL